MRPNLLTRLLLAGTAIPAALVLTGAAPAAQAERSIVVAQAGLGAPGGAGRGGADADPADERPRRERAQSGEEPRERSPGAGGQRRQGPGGPAGAEPSPGRAAPAPQAPGAAPGARGGGDDIGGRGRGEPPAGRASPGLDTPPAGRPTTPPALERAPRPTATEPDAPTRRREAPERTPAPAQTPTGAAPPPAAPRPPAATAPAERPSEGTQPTPAPRRAPQGATPSTVPQTSPAQTAPPAQPGAAPRGGQAPSTAPATTAPQTSPAPASPTSPYAVPPAATTAPPAQPGAAPRRGQAPTTAPATTAPPATPSAPASPQPSAPRAGQAPGTAPGAAPVPGTPPGQSGAPLRPGLAPVPGQALPAPTAAPPTTAGAPGGRDVRIDELRAERRERVEEGGRRVIIEEPGGRTIVREGDRVIIRHDESDRFRRSYGGAAVRTERRGDNEVTIVRRPNGTEIVSIRDARGDLVRRVRRESSGAETILIENERQGRPRRTTIVEEIVDLPPPRITIPREKYVVEVERASQGDLVEAFTAPPVERIERRYTLDEVRMSQTLRERVRRVDVDTVTFDFGSWVLAENQVGALSGVAQAIRDAIERNPNEIFLVEGHTDAVGADVDNLTLSDRRAETVAAILTERFGIPAENLTTQGYGEQYLKINTQEPERQNRRVSIRRITPLLQGAER